VWPFSKTKQSSAPVSPMHAVDALRKGIDDISVFKAAHVGWCSSYGLRPDCLRMVWQAVLAAKEPVLDVGSGLSTIIMGLAAEKSGVPVHALEADHEWAAKLEAQLAAFRIKTVTVHRCKIVNGWYELPDLPGELGVVLIDGPQHHLPARVLAFDRLQSRIPRAVVMVDDINMGLAGDFHRWVMATRRVTKRTENFAVSMPWRG
jgi:predicted O-methyltransferase YrrM